jgi:hypothetical protein
MSVPESKKADNRQSRIILILITVFLIGSIGLNFFFYSKSGEVVVITQHRTDTLVVENNTLEMSVKNKIAELESYRGKTKSLDQLITQGEARLSKLGEEAIALRAASEGDEKKTKEYEKKRNELDKISSQLLGQIEILVTKNRTLKKKNDSLSVGLSETNHDKTLLADKVKKASTLQIEYVKVTALKKKMLSKKMEETSSAFMVSQINTCFQILENSVATQGPRTITLRILDPQGKTLGDVVKGSGTFVSAVGDTLQYTSHKSINYAGAKSDQCMDYATPEKRTLGKGSYSVEIYLDGVLRSSTPLVLK